MNTCTICLEAKPYSDFEKNSRMRSGYLNQCRKCKYRRRHDDPAQRAKKYQSVVRWRRKVRYGVTDEQYYLQLASQGGLCAICRHIDSNKALAVDHDHDTGQARMLLCSNCNLLIGHADEDIEILEAAIRYLQDMRNKGLSRSGRERSGGDYK